jgi:hypothetical protein
MRLFAFLFFWLLFFAPLHISAQDETPEHFCGYRGYSPWLTWYQNNAHLMAADRGLDTGWMYVPITLHITGNDNGSGYYGLQGALLDVCQLNQQFVPARIRFYLLKNDPVRYHNNTKWHDHDWAAGGDMIKNTRLPDRLNAYVVADPAGNCGYAWQSVIVLGKNCSGTGNSTWAHEAGHHFSLPHPFFGWEDRDWNFGNRAPAEWNGYPVEKMNGSNCKTAGDRFCDTRPDYLSDRWNCNSNRESNTRQLDPDSTEFRSDGTLIMGYANDACQSRFTAEQITAMRTNLRTERSSYLAQMPDMTEVTGTVELNSPVDSQAVQFNAATFSWTPVTNARYYNLQVSLTPGFSTLFYNGIITDGATSLTVRSGLFNNRSLYWRVRAFNDWDVCGIDDQPAEVGVFRTRNFTATNDLERAAQIELAPNPAPGGQPARLSVVADQPMTVLLSVTDAAGRLCHRQQLRFFAGENQLDIPTADLQAGIYIVALQNEKGLIVKRLAIAE